MTTRHLWKSPANPRFISLVYKDAALGLFYLLYHVLMLLRTYYCIFNASIQTQAKQITLALHKTIIKQYTLINITTHTNTETYELEYPQKSQITYTVIILENIFTFTRLQRKKGYVCMLLIKMIKLHLHHIETYGWLFSGFDNG